MANPSEHGIRSYRDLRVWQVAMDLVVSVYRASGSFPKLETYGLVSQVRRSAVSVPANIAEGQGREHLGEYLHHLSIANGSLMELETHVLIAGRLDYLSPTESDALLRSATDVACLLAGLIRALKRHQRKRNPDT